MSKKVSRLADCSLSDPALQLELGLVNLTCECSAMAQSCKTYILHLFFFYFLLSPLFSLRFFPLNLHFSFLGYFGGLKSRFEFKPQHTRQYILKQKFNHLNVLQRIQVKEAKLATLAFPFGENPSSHLDDGCPRYQNVSPRLQGKGITNFSTSA